MTFDPESTQAVNRALKRKDPIRWAIWAILTLPALATLLVSAVGLSITAIVQFRGLRNDVTSLKAAIVSPQEQGERIAKLEQRVEDIEKRFDRFDSWKPDARLRAKPKR